MSQIGEVVRVLGQNPTENEIKKLIINYQGNDRITFEVFLPIVQVISSKGLTDTNDDLIEGLRHFDKEGKGLITSAELHHLLTTFGEKLTDEETELLLVGHQDSSGNINYENFVNFILTS